MGNLCDDSIGTEFSQQNISLIPERSSFVNLKEESQMEYTFLTYVLPRRAKLEKFTTNNLES